MALYRTGTASLDAAGTITGVGTKWRDPLTLIRTGATIIFLGDGIKLAVISDIISDTEMRAITTDGATATDSKYVILLNDSLTVDGMAQDVAETLRYYQSQETVIAEAIEFFEKFDLKTLQELVKQVTDAIPIVEQSKQEAAQSAQSALTSRNEAEQLKTETGQIKAETEQLKNETQTIKTETDQIKTDTQAIKDSALTEITAVKNSAVTDVAAVKDSAVADIGTAKDAAISDVSATKDSVIQEVVSEKDLATQAVNAAKDSAIQEVSAEKDTAIALMEGVKKETFDARDAAKAAQAGAELAEAGANNAHAAAEVAKAGAEAARDEAEELAKQLNPENLLRKDNNLSDIQDKKIARQNLEVDHFVQDESSTSLKAGDYRIAVNISGDWGALDKDDQWKALAISQGGTGSNSVDGARANLLIDRVKQHSADETFLFAGDSDESRLTINKSGLWGMFEQSSSSWIALDVAQGGTGALNADDARRNLDVYSKGDLYTKEEVDALIKASGGGGGGWVGKVEWHHAAGIPVPGYIQGSGQILNRSDVPDLVRAMEAGLVFVTDENTWLNDPRIRGHYTWGDGVNTIRVPDYNGVQNGSRQAPFLRGFLPGNDGLINDSYVPNLYTVIRQRVGLASGTTNQIPSALMDANTPLVSVVYNGAENRGAMGISTSASYARGHDVIFNASAYNGVYRDGVNDAAPNAINGVWLIKATGRLTTELEAEPSPVSNSAELKSLRNEVAELKAAFAAMKDK